MDIVEIAKTINKIDEMGDGALESLLEIVKARTHDPEDIALDAFSKLNKKTDKNGNYLSMTIKYYGTFEAYICSFPMSILSDHFIIYDDSTYKPQWKETKVFSREKTIKFIKGIPQIEYIGLQEDSENPDIITELYNKF
jgi:hypothetical protein